MAEEGADQHSQTSIKQEETDTLSEEVLARNHWIYGPTIRPSGADDINLAWEEVANIMNTLHLVL